MADNYTINIYPSQIEINYGSDGSVTGMSVQYTRNITNTTQNVSVTTSRGPFPLPITNQALLTMLGNLLNAMPNPPNGQ